MFIDAEAMPESPRVEADICVIGAGAAGITLARQLGARNRRVVVFESGGFEFNEDTQRLYDGEIVGLRFLPLNADRLRYLGGATNHWAGSCRPFEASEFEGWPFGIAELDPFYREAQQVLQLGPYSYELADWVTEASPALDFGAGRFQSGIFQYSPPTRFGSVYRQELQTSQNVVVYLNANLVSIETNDLASEVSGVGLACLNGRRFRALARHYVLATGGIENPRLLLNADHVQKAGLGNRYDLVGRYFMDHPYLSGVASVVFANPTPNLSFYQPHDVRGQIIQGSLTPTPEERKRHGFPSVNVGLMPGNLAGGDFARESLQTIYRSVASGHWPDNLSRHVSNIMAGVERHATVAYESLTHTRPVDYSTACMFGLPPDPQSRVMLSDKVDPLGLRRVKLDWRLPADFPATVQRIHEAFAAELGRTGLGRLRFNSKVLESDLSEHIFNGHHHMGTTRMHTDPRHGVVDENCRVHGVSNLFIAGSSVFPTYSFDDPTMTIVALALRLSDHLKSLSG